MHSDPWRAIDLFAGAGGMSLGLSWSGWDVLGVERDPDACATHAQSVGPCVCSDVATWHPSGPATLVAGGWPCPAFSDANSCRVEVGLSADRGGLFRQLLRVASEAGAVALIGENVLGALRRRHGDVELPADAISREWSVSGWHVTRAILNAADFGVPQHRLRLVWVAFRSPVAAAAFRWPVPTHGPHSPGRKPWATVRVALALHGHYIVGRTPAAIAGGWYNGGRYIDVDQPSPTINAKYNPEWIYPRGRDPRRLTTAECAILQGFPAHMRFVGSVVSAHRQVGNALPPQVASALGHSVRTALDVTR